ncbi:universal stress protein [Candidatus Protofrankia californiensis]|uniref:universal stress protein n=1 Tax=Candidatus Protofrankia californiensis TaxID=1839754 RepID=UPI001F493D84|nr:universal stress protein [Candidatus Protofrankia californiensis]
MNGVETTFDIVVGIDASADAELALRWAFAHAGLTGTRIRAVLAWGPGGRPRVVDDISPSIGVDDLEHAALQVLHDAVRRTHPGDLAVDVVERTVYDAPSDALVEESRDALMLVVGARGLARMRRMFVGSVTARCAQEAPVPVVVVRGPAPPEPDGRPILVGVDGSESSLAALRWAALQAGLRRVPLRVARCWLPEPPFDPVCLPAFDPPAFDEAVLEKAARLTLDTAVEQGLASRTDVAVEAVLVADSAAHGLIVAARSAQLLVVGARGRGGFGGLLLGSVSHQVVTHAPCPVAVIR